jgi:nitric oxide reductase subunit B
MRRLWFAFGAVLIVSFSVLLWAGARIYQMAPPVPDRVVSAGGRVVFDRGDVRAGQEVWRSLGGMEVGSVWGHGSYLAPDWTADWLHREAVAVLDEWSASEHGGAYAALPAEAQGGLRARLAAEYRRNTYDPVARTIAISDARARAVDLVASHLESVFRDGREDYAIPPAALAGARERRELAAFIFWTAWAAATARPGQDLTYTSNWPHEPLLGHRPSADAVVWTGVSIILLLAGIGAMAFWHAARRPDEQPARLPEEDPLLGSAPTPSQRATIKFFWVVCGLVLAQILLGVVTAHYGVEGNAFYGMPLAEILPYAVSRTWHVQLGIFWIATAWLGAGLVIAPAVGAEPAGQRGLVNLLFAALLAVVVGSLAGEWLSVRGVLGSDDAWWWFGHSGYEYIDLGRAFQLALMVGLFLWAFLVARALRPALARPDERQPLLVLLLISTLAIAGFYLAALGAGRHTNLAVAEYWRWWVVHLWVEGFFEVFATVVIAFLFARLGLVSARAAGRTTVLAATIFLAGGVIGTLHHLYFTGTPTAVLALGAVSSALEVVPLVFLGKDAWENWRLSGRTPWMRSYRRPIHFFIGVAFWNLVGAGLFGFMINPPIALYYMQGLNTTPVHGHTALFGVYGLLGMGLVLFAVRAARPDGHLPDRLLGFSFWTMNGGLLAMVLLSILPVGLLQTWASVEHGYWYARSSEFLHGGAMGALRWLRVVGDTAFAAGAVAFAIAVLRATLGRSGEGSRLARASVSRGE